MVWRLCVDHKGNVIRQPAEVQHGWSLEEVLDAHVVMDMMMELLDRAAEAPKKK